MLRFLATLAGIVVVVWGLSLFAAPPMPIVEGRDITTPDPTGPVRAPLVQQEDLAPAAQKREDPEREEQKIEWKSKAQKGKHGEGKRKRG